MVKSLTAIAVCLALLIGLAAFEWTFVDAQFESFREEVLTLADKTEAGTANGEDARAVMKRWETRKRVLYALIPHGDVTRLDDYLAETERLIEEGEFVLARAKIEILLRLSETIPGTYKPGLENVF